MKRPIVKTVLAHGCFDLLHPGHLAHLQEAKTFGERLVVSITADRFINKGPGRPVYNEAQRAAMLMSLKCVDDVFVCQGESAELAIRKYRPDVYVKGPDYTDRLDGGFVIEQELVAQFGGVTVTTSGETKSSTALINQYVRPLDSAFDKIRNSVDFGSVVYWLQLAATKTASVRGERITDIYQYVLPAWKSAKDNTIDFIESDQEEFNGGASIVHAHAAHFAKKVEMRQNGPWPIVKTRFIDPFNHKLFNLVNQSSFFAPVVGKEFVSEPNDVSIVADFGHGLFDATQAKNIAERLRDLNKFLALTVQSNGTNWGFNLYHKWPFCDYLVIDHMELRLGNSNLKGDLITECRIAAAKMDVKYLAVTLGHQGCIVYNGVSDEAFQLPVLTDKVIDRVGAGDAFLAATATLAAVGAPIEVIALVGNAAGAVQVGISGNGRAVTRSDVERVIKGVLG